jgi:hypothetical protein
VARRPSPAVRRARVKRLGHGRTGVALGIILLLAVGAFGLLNDGEGAQQDPGTGISQPEPSALPGAAASPDVTALEMLATIAVKGKAPRTGYDRTEKFGSAWIDVDGNGCDTRNDILTRDLTQVVFGDNCRVLSGTIDDPYTGEIISFVRGNTTSTLVQIDHVVALSNAWQTGAQQLSEESRIAFANDPLNLLAVDGSANSQKGDGDTATWLPQNTTFRCEYVARQVSVKASYNLWVTTAEHDAMVRVLSRCPQQATPVG